MLSKESVVAASRKFICIRPLTYEDKVEADYLRKMFAPRGFLENTVFAIMDPKTTKYLAGPGRGPDWSFPGADQDASIMARGLDKMAAAFKAKEKPASLPLVKDLRFGMNVAACDNVPLVALTGTAEEQAALREKVAKLSWDERFIGQFSFTTAPSDDLKKVIGEVKPAGISIVAPDEFGAKGKLLGFVPTYGDLGEGLANALAAFKPLNHTDHRGHLQRGVRLGIRWKTAIPCEDQQGNGATQRLWGG